MTIGKAQKRATAKYRKENYFVVTVMFPKVMKAEIQRCSRNLGMSIGEFVRTAAYRKAGIHGESD